MSERASSSIPPTPRATPVRRRALVLTGGGARGAYQVGVLKYLAENVDEPEFKILLGSSAGAINVAALASQEGNFREAVAEMERVWSGLRLQDVLNIGFLSLARAAGYWLLSLIYSGFTSRPLINSLIDSSPLGHLVAKVFKPENVARSLAAGKFETLAIAATEVRSASSVTFVQSKDPHRSWSRANRRSESTVLAPEHILASSAIPFLFRAVRIGNYQYLDGSVRSNTPLSPAARLGATEIFSIGVRKVANSDDLAKFNQANPGPELEPSASQIAGLILNSLFSDALDSDADHLRRINELLEHTDHEAALNKAGMKPIHVFLVRPSQDIGRVANRFVHRLPLFLRFLMRGIGAEKLRSNDILSYLLFDAEYAKVLIDMGYRDAAAQREELLGFFRGQAASAAEKADDKSQKVA